MKLGEGIDWELPIVVIISCITMIACVSLLTNTMIIKEKIKLQNNTGNILFSYDQCVEACTWGFQDCGKSNAIAVSYGDVDCHMDDCKEYCKEKVSEQ